MVTVMIIVVKLTNTAKKIKAITTTKTMTYSNNEDDDDYGLIKPE